MRGRLVYSSNAREAATIEYHGGYYAGESGKDTKSTGHRRLSVYGDGS